MRVAVVFNLKPAGVPESLPDDWYEEFDAPETIDQICEVLRGLGHETSRLEALPGLEDRLRQERPDIVFNIAEGFQGRCREALVPALCEWLAIPYTGSDPLTQCVCLDKIAAKRLVAPDVPSPSAVRVGPELSADRLRYPLVVKPRSEGSSQGIRGSNIVRNPRELEERIRELTARYGKELMVEEFVGGPEVTVGVGTLRSAEPAVIGMLRIKPRKGEEGDFLYGLDYKRNWRELITYESPPRLPQEHLARLGRLACEAFRILGCADVARIDFRFDTEGAPYFLECNPLPGLRRDYGDVVLGAAGYGLSYEDLIDGILRSACRRYGWTHARGCGVQ